MDEELEKQIAKTLYKKNEKVKLFTDPEIIKFAKSIDTIIIENEQNDYKIYK